MPGALLSWAAGRCLRHSNVFVSTAYWYTTHALASTHFAMMGKYYSTGLYGNREGSESAIPRSVDSRHSRNNLLIDRACTSTVKSDFTLWKPPTEVVRKEHVYLSSLRVSILRNFCTSLPMLKRLKGFKSSLRIDTRKIFETFFLRVFYFCNIERYLRIDKKATL